MMKVYLICIAWSNTKGNHAGMLYLAEQMKKRLPFEIELISIPVRGSWFLQPFYRILNVLIAFYLRFKVRDTDAVFLMEYLLPVCEQSDIAKILKNKCRVLALAHMIPRRIEQFYTQRQIQQKIDLVDKLLVLGSSLNTFFQSKGVLEKKIVTTFHYVDTDFYYPKATLEHKRLSVICMGNMERDYIKLKELIRNLPTVQFKICMGVKDLTSTFADIPNVELYGYMEEQMLRDLMCESDVSLNFMYDTVGSNVITTSLAVGLIVLASDVGSIGDYVTHGKDGFLFEDTNDALKYLQCLDGNTTLRNEMKCNARTKAQQINLEHYCEWFTSFINKNYGI